MILNELHDRNRKNLRAKGYDENNAAITREEFSQTMAQRFRTNQWLAGRSLIVWLMLTWFKNLVGM